MQQKMSPLNTPLIPELFSSLHAEYLGTLGTWHTNMDIRKEVLMQV